MRELLVLLIFTAASSAVTPALGDEPRAGVDGPEIAHVDFERHIASLFGRLGCNSGMCHGSFQGQGGFRLSLFGQSSQEDYEALNANRVPLRINREAPEQSLLLTKPSGREEHEGGIRFRPDSWEDRLFRRWIEQGAKHIPGSGSVRSLVIEFEDLPPTTIGQTKSLRVIAQFLNEEQEDITAFCEFRSRDETIAAVTSTGTVTALASGATAIVVSYRGAFASVPVLVPFTSDGNNLPAPPSNNLIDETVGTRLQRLALTVSPPASDAEFLRRATLDVIATLPTPEEVRRFLSDPAPDKRERKIDELLAHPRRAAVWATKLCDLTGCNIDTLESPEPLRVKRAKMWHDWFRQRFAENVRYDAMVHDVLCATSRQGQLVETWMDQEAALLRAAETGFETNYAERESLDLFWRRTGPDGQIAVEDFAELTASAFLGLRLHCARCHHHPYDHWSQQDFAGYASIFARVQFGSSTELRTAMNNRLETRRKAREQGSVMPELPRLQEVFVSAAARPLTDAAGSTEIVPRAPDGPSLASAADPREALFDWLTQRDNPYFSKNLVNRAWAKYFGKGLVDPVDALSASNPPTDTKLLQRLADEFVGTGYDIAHLERLILTSQTYQRSSRSTGNNIGDRDGFARASVRALPAETLIDALNAALESSNDFGPDVPPGSHAIELAPSRFSTRRVNDLFRILGRGDRKSLCDCDRSSAPSIRQTIYLMSDPQVLQKIKTGRLVRLLEANRTDTEIIDEFYLATLSRMPEDDERALLIQYVSATTERLEAFADIIWALMNSREFTTNH